MIATAAPGDGELPRPRESGEFPRDVPEKRDTTAWVGMVVFLASWAMMFAALFFSYAMLRISTPVWPPRAYEPLPLLLPGINTALMVVSSVTLHLGIVEVRRGKPLLRWLVVTLALAIAFMALQGVVWTELWATGFELSSGHYGAVFYLLTLFHGLHVIVGLGLLLSLFPGSRRGSASGRPSTRLRLTAMFWHFVDVVWVLIFFSVYVF